MDANLKDGRDTATSGTGLRRLRSALAISELALAVVLVAASALLLRSFVLLSNVDPGFDAHNVLTVNTMLPLAKYGDATKRNGFFDEVTRKLKELPGVRSVGRDHFPAADQHHDDADVPAGRSRKTNRWIKCRQWSRKTCVPDISRRCACL